MTGRGDRAALERLLGGSEMRWLVDRVRSRILAAGVAPLSGVVQLRQPSAAQRDAAVRLVGRPKRAGTAVRVDLGQVEQVLRRGPWPAGLADAVELLTGPVTDRAGERAEDAAGWLAAQEMMLPALEHSVELGRWWARWCATGGLKRMARAEAGRTGVTPGPAVAVELVSRGAAVMAVLPSAAEPLAVLSRRMLGDAHGLDESRPLGRLVLAVAAQSFAARGVDDGGAGRPRSTREVWAAAGVVMSSVASTVLVLGASGRNIQGVGGLATATATSLEAMRAAGAPLLLTLDQVRSGGLAPLPATGVVHVCENPTVVEVVAARWTQIPDGADGPVLVCTWGQPSAAVVELLAILTSEGAVCRYHGDFDWPGLRIARALAARVPWTPWRFASDDYLAAVRGGALSLSLSGPPAESPWDPALATAMAEHGLAVEEEAVAALLASDLMAPPRGSEQAGARA